MGRDNDTGEGEVLTDWKNRIIGHGDEPLDEILFNPANWRIHPKAQQEALEGVLSQVGFVQDVIINKQTGHLVDGHLRCQVAARNGEKTIPAVYVDLTPEEESLILATIDPLSAMAATDKQKLDDLLHAVQSDDARVQTLMEMVAVNENIIPAVDYEKEWQGMPEFNQEDLGAVKSVIVHFASRDDISEFEKLVEQAITDKTKSLWFPKQERENLIAFVAHDES